MDIIVAGRRVRNSAEYAEVALADFTPTPADLEDFAEFVEDTSHGSSIDAEDVSYFRRQNLPPRVTRRRRSQDADIVPLPRRRATGLNVEEVRAA